MKKRIRDAMVEGRETFLRGIVEADETFVGGKPRGKRNRKNSVKSPDSSQPENEEYKKLKRGRGTKKLPVIEAVAKGRKVVAQPSPKVTAKTLGTFLKHHVDGDDSVLMTGEFPAYRRMGDWAPHLTVNHAVPYVEGLIHTNTVEGLWSLVKRALYRRHHHYSKEHAAAYIVKACYKYISATIRTSSITSVRGR